MWAEGAVKAEKQASGLLKRKMVVESFLACREGGDDVQARSQCDSVNGSSEVAGNNQCLFIHAFLGTRQA